MQNVVSVRRNGQLSVIGAKRIFGVKRDEGGIKEPCRRRKRAYGGLFCEVRANRGGTADISDIFALAVSAKAVYRAGFLFSPSDKE